MTRTSCLNVLSKYDLVKWIAAIGINLTAGVATTLAVQIAGVEVGPPLPAMSFSDTYWGTSVADPYRFLENTQDPVVAGWMRDQASATTSILNKIPGRSTLLAA